MIRAEKVEGRLSRDDEAWEVCYETPISEGCERFGGYKAREKATNFAIEKLEELLDNPPE